MVETKKRTLESLVYKDGIWQYEKVIKTLEYVQSSKDFIEVGQEVVYTPISERAELVKTLDFNAVFVRVAFSDDLEQIGAVFKQAFRIEIPLIKQYEHTFVSLSSAKPFLHYLNFGITEPLPFDSEFLRKIGKPKKLTEEESLEILQAIRNTTNLSKVIRKEAIEYLKAKRIFPQVLKERPNGELWITI